MSLIKGYPAVFDCAAMLRLPLSTLLRSDRLSV
jgi:hypothetical protein